LNGGVIGYIKRLSDILMTTEATDGRGAPVELETAMDRAVDLAREANQAGAKILLVGNGGSAAVVSHMQNDLCKAAGLKAMVFTEHPLLTALTNDDGYETAYEFQIRLWAMRGDVLIAVSSSGGSENILRACKAASDLNASIVTFSGFAPDNTLRSLGDVNFYIRSHSYGQVETAHAALGHYLTDALAEQAGEVGPVNA
jgi:D-sedoheptulose 7-phosphate isomerase